MNRLRTRRAVALLCALPLVLAWAFAGAAVAASPSPRPTPHPTPHPTYPPVQCSAPTLFVSSTTVTPGETITISGCGYGPGQTVTITLHSSPVVLAVVTVGSNGRFSTQVTIPLDTSFGHHYLEASGTSAGQTASIAVVVKPAPAAAHSSSSGGLPFTGADIAGMVLAGLILVSGGTMLLVAARRRRTASAV